MEGPNTRSLVDFVQEASELSVGLGELADSLPGVSAAYRGFCQVAAGTPGAQALKLVNVANVCTPYLQSIGRGFAESVQPFTGGQCDTKRYRVTDNGFTWRDSDGNVFNVPGSGTVRIGDGPLSLVKDRNNQRWRIEFGTVGEFAKTADVSNEGDDAVITAISQTIETTDGTPDDCGDPESTEIPGPGWNGETYGTPFDVDGPDGNTYSVDVGLPEVGVNGDLEIPFNVDEINFNFGDGGGGGSGSDGPVDLGPVETGDPVSGGSDDGEQNVESSDPNLICVAVGLQVFGLGLTRGGVPGSEPNFRTYDVFGNFSVKVSGESGEVHYSRSIDLNSEFTVEPIPVEGLRITDFKVNLAEGLSYTATPYYRDKTQGES